VPERLAFGTAVYTNGLIMGEIIPVAMMLPLVMPYFSDNWRWALGVWAFPLIATAATVAMLAPKSAANRQAGSRDGIAGSIGASAWQWRASAAPTFASTDFCPRT
jgi:MFS transporter, CP family, cyanate transporter